MFHSRRSLLGRSGFTLVEVLVVASIIALISGVVFFAARESSEQSRDAKRQSDLRNLQNAIALYKNRYGQYPEGCNGAGNWSGQNGTAMACSSGNEYIVGLAPEFISSLPRDPNLNGEYFGYAYLTNSDRSVFKLYAWQSVESETVTYGNEFASCDLYAGGTLGLCANVHFTGNTTPNWCQQSNDQFQSSYAVWGGFADGGNDTIREENTEDVVCQRPPS